MVAPHLVRPLPFLVPLTPETPYGAASLLAGTGAVRRAVGLPRRPAPALGTDAARSVRAGARPPTASRGAVRYHDHVTHDARLTLAVLDGAAEAGALVLNHVEVVGLRTLGGHVHGADAIDRLTGAAIEVRARVVVNAAGPWTTASPARAARRRADGAAVSRHAPRAAPPTPAGGPR